MTTVTVAQPRVAAAPHAAIVALARIEAGRMLCHPAPWLGIALTLAFANGVLGETWAAAQYEGLLAATAPMLLGVSVSAVYAFGREQVAVSDDAPLSASRRSVARLLGGLALVGLVAVVVATTAVWMRLGGGIAFGDEPGRTTNAQYTLPELLQPVLLAAFAVALAAAVVHVLRNRLVASILLFVWWFLLGTAYWLFNGTGVRWLTPVQVQPVYVEVVPPAAGPSDFPSTWILAAPGEYQDHWARLVVSPSLAAWHDVYLVALTILAVAVAVPGRHRRVLVAGGAVLAVLAVLLQRMVTP